MQNCMADDWQTRPSFEDIGVQLATICGRYQKREEQKAAVRVKPFRGLGAGSRPQAGFSRDGADAARCFGGGGPKEGGTNQGDCSCWVSS